MVQNVNNSRHIQFSISLIRPKTDNKATPKKIQNVAQIHRMDYVLIYSILRIGSQFIGDSDGFFDSFAG